MRSAATNKSERKLKWDQIEAAYNEWIMGTGEPYRSHGALSCIYYRTKYRIPVTNSDGLLDLRWEYGEEVEARIQMEMELELQRLEEEARKRDEGGEEEQPACQTRTLMESEDGAYEYEEGPGTDEDEEYKDQEEPEIEDGAESTEQNNKKTKAKGRKDKKKKKKIEVPYPYSVHGDVGIPTVDYRNSWIKVREGGDVPLLHRFPEVMADERNTWVLPEHKAQAKEIAARRIQQRLEWREWMKQNHPRELPGLEKKKKGSCPSSS